LTKLEQINGFGGQTQFIFDVEQVLEPGVIGLGATGGLPALIPSRKYARGLRRHRLRKAGGRSPQFQ
jgi:hypothetical protein